MPAENLIDIFKKSMNQELTKWGPLAKLPQEPVFEYSSRKHCHDIRLHNVYGYFLATEAELNCD